MNEIKKEEFTIQNNNFVEENIKNTTNQTDHAPKECPICFDQLIASDRNGKNGKVGHNANKRRIVGHNANKGNTAIFKEYSSSKKYENPRHWMHEACLAAWTKKNEWCPCCKKELDPKSLCLGSKTQEKLIGKNVALKMLEGKSLIPKKYFVLAVFCLLFGIIPGIACLCYYKKCKAELRKKAFPLDQAIKSLKRNQKQCIRDLVPWMNDNDLVNEAATICKGIQTLKLSQVDMDLVVKELKRFNPHDRYFPPDQLVDLFKRIWEIGPNRTAVIDYYINNSNFDANSPDWTNIYTDLRAATNLPQKNTSLKSISENPIQTILDLAEIINNKPQLYQLAHTGNFEFPHIVLKEFGSVSCFHMFILQKVMGTLFPALSKLAPDAFPRLRFPNSQFLPTLDPNSEKMNISQQIELCKILGHLICVILQHPNEMLCTGIHFPPSLFQSIRSLSVEELELIGEKFKAKEDVPKQVLDKITNLVQQDIRNIDVLKWIFDKIANFAPEEDIANSDETSLKDNLQSNKKAEQAALAILHIVLAIYQSIDNKSQWDRFQKISPEALNEEIQGSLSHDVFMASLKWPPSSSLTGQPQNFLNRWVQESTVTQRKTFVKKIIGRTGRTTLKPPSPRIKDFHRQLDVTAIEGKDQPPEFHSGFSMLIFSSKYTNYEIFKELLNKSLE